MRSLIFLTSLFFCRVSSAQSLSSMPLDELPTCSNGMPPSSRQMNDDSHLHILLGYAPSLTCAEPLPVDDKCTCTCRDGAVYNQTRPDLLGSVPTTPGTAGVVPRKLPNPGQKFRYLTRPTRWSLLKSSPCMSTFSKTVFSWWPMPGRDVNTSRCTSTTDLKQRRMGMAHLTTAGAEMLERNV